MFSNNLSKFYVLLCKTKYFSSLFISLICSLFFSFHIVSLKNDQQNIYQEM